MSYTPRHEGCPKDGRSLGRDGSFGGRQVVVYRREWYTAWLSRRGVEEGAQRRRFVRVGLLCLSCKQFTPDSPEGGSTDSALSASGAPLR